MRNKSLILTLVSVILVIMVNAQYETRFGDYCSPRDTLRVLSIFIHIDYDLCPECDPVKYPTPNWPGALGNSVNVGGPIYLSNYIDTEFDPDNITGKLTKRFAEASFNQFIVLSDFVVVNIKQSFIEPSGESFNMHALRDSAISVINGLGGLKTIYGHNSILDYDGSEISDRHRFQEKTTYYNDSIDFIQFYLRNTTSHYGTVYNGGRTDVGACKIKNPLIIDGIPHFNDMGFMAGRIANNDLSNPSKQPVDVHEIAHNLIGMLNSAHMGGGAPVGSGNVVTLNFNNGGWSLLGSANSSLVSCNGYERWRLDWRGLDNQEYRIACQNQNSDIVNKNDPSSFVLRDFVTTGDAVRIKLPYVDSGALAQYIWLENHQIHKNGKEDYPAYWKESCKDDGIAGIYAYYQVGKDALEGNSIDKKHRDMIPNYADHLIPISAEGNWDYKLLQGKKECCISWNEEGRNIQEYFRENPLSGYNDLEYHFFNSADTNKLNFANNEVAFFLKKKNGQLFNNLASLGDNLDPFTDSRTMSISSNPSPVNVVTYHHFRYSNGIISYPSRLIDNRKIHLSGLKIDFKEELAGEIKVDVRWDHYDVDNSVLWSGDIDLHEKLNLLNGKTITLDQNLTPNKHIRDTVTGVFAGPTYFTCLEGSEFSMQPESEVDMKNLSSFILEPGSSMELNDNSRFTVNAGCTFVVQENAELLVKGSGRIEIEKEAHVCIEPGAKITLQDPLSVINLRPGYYAGVNSNVLEGYNCIENPSDYASLGNGNINKFMRTVHIQNETITKDRYVTGRIIKVGNNVTILKPPGEVNVIGYTELIIDAKDDVLLDEGFTIFRGTDLEIR